MSMLYSPSDVSEQLGIQSSTLRKYADVLEKEGYSFTKNERGHRKYKDSDIIAFRKLITIKSDTDMTLESAAKQVIAWHQGVEVLPLDSHEVERYEDASFNATALQVMIQEHIEKHNELLEELTKRLAERDQSAAQRHEELLTAIQTIRDSQSVMALQNSQAEKEAEARHGERDKALLEMIREVQEVKKMLAASQDKKWYEFWK